MPSLTRPDAHLVFEVAGTGSPIVFIQGIGVAGSGWAPQVEAFKRNFQCLTFDNRGLGRSVPCTGTITIESMSADVIALMDHLGWGSAHVVGHSMGGVIAQQVALDAPQRVRSLSLLCTFARGKDGARPTPRILWMSLRTRVGTRRMRRRAFLELVVPRKDLDRTDPDALAEGLAPLLGRDLADSPPILMKQLKALGRHDAFHRLAQLSGIPTWVASASLDPIASPDFGRQLAAAIPGARFDLLEGSSHAVPLTHPERVHPLLKDFLNSVESRTT